MYLRTDRRELHDDFTESAVNTVTDSTPQTASWFSGKLDTTQPTYVSSYAQRFCVLDIAPVKNIAPLPDGMALFILQTYISDTEHYVEKLDNLGTPPHAEGDHIKYVPFIGHLRRLECDSDIGLPLHSWLFADKQPAITLTTGISALDACRPLTQFQLSCINTVKFDVPAGDPFADFIDLVGDEAARRAQWKIIADTKYPARHFPTALARLTHRMAPAAGHMKHVAKHKIK